MPRAIWKGAITFGLVHIPVELHPAEERREFKFSMLDKRDFSPVGYKRYSKKSGKEVEWSDIVKGYEYEKDQYVVLSDEDFRRANSCIENDRHRDFFPRAEIPTQFTSPYSRAAARGERLRALGKGCARPEGGVAQSSSERRSPRAGLSKRTLLMLISLPIPTNARNKGLSLGRGA